MNKREGQCGYPRCRSWSLLGYQPNSEAPKVELCETHWAWMAEWETKAERNARLQKLGYSRGEIEACDFDEPDPEPKGSEEEMATKVAKTTDGKKKSTGIRKSTKGKGKKPVAKPEPEAKAGPKRGEIRQTWMEIFLRNEKVKVAHRQCDQEIHDEMNRRFPGRNSWEFTNVAGVQQVRRAYNRGDFTDGPPEIPSRRFDDDGAVMEMSPRGRKAGGSNESKAENEPTPKKKAKGIRKAKK